MNNEDQNLNQNNEEGGNNPESEPQMENPVEHKDKPIGPAIGTIVIVLILIVGGFYIWGSRVDEKTKNLVDETKSAEDILGEVDETADKLGQQSNSDEITDIEDDLSDTILEDLDKELENIDAELAI